jgi:uncharacterized protein (TIGR00369 family)
MARMDALARIKQTRPPFAELLGIEVVSASPDKIVAEMTVREDLCTSPTVLHGGAIMAFADTLGAMGTIVNLPQGAGTTTIESKTNFVAAGSPGGRGNDADSSRPANNDLADASSRSGRPAPRTGDADPARSVAIFRRKKRVFEKAALEFERARSSDECVGFLRAEGPAYGPGCLAIARLMLTRLSAITPRPTRRRFMLGEALIPGGTKSSNPSPSGRARLPEMTSTGTYLRS